MGIHHETVCIHFIHFYMLGFSWRLRACAIKFFGIKYIFKISKTAIEVIANTPERHDWDDNIMD